MKTIKISHINGQEWTIRKVISENFTDKLLNTTVKSDGVLHFSNSIGRIHIPPNILKNSIICINDTDDDIEKHSSLTL